MRLVATTLLLSCTAFSAFAQEIPAKVKESLQRALQTKDAFLIDSAFTAAEKQYPNHKAALDDIRNPKAKADVVVVAPVAEEEKTYWQRWSGEVGGGMILEGGNTETTSFTGDVRGKYDGEVWSDLLELKARYREEDNVRTRENYSAYNRLDRSLTEDLFAFVGLQFEKDSFAGYDQRTSETVGLGYKIIQEENMKLEALGSVGMRQTDFTDGTDENEWIFEPSARFSWNITPSLSFAQNVGFTIGEESTVSRSRTELTNQLFGGLHARLMLDLEHNSKVPANTDKLDSEFSVNLLYKF